jgi:uncharacterized protein GlcG (DUF336 family)
MPDSSAAEAEAKKRNWKMNIAVVDPNGDLIQFLRMDGAQVASVAISQRPASAGFFLDLSLVESRTGRWSAQFHALPRLARLRRRAEYV